MTPLSGLKVYTLLQRGKRFDQAICTKIYTLPQGSKYDDPVVWTENLYFAPKGQKN